eukprot:12468899-Ditylum_brightwellii.AAC.1
MNKDVASSMKESADGDDMDDEGNEYMCSENVVMFKNGATYVSFKYAIKLHKKIRSVHDEWEEDGILGTGNLEEMNNFDVD